MVIRRWSAAAWLTVLLGVAPAAQAVDPDAPLADPAAQALYEKLTREVRCLVCQNQPIADSTAPLAADLRREIRAMITAGRGEGEIREFLVARYGDFVLYRPRMSGAALTLWLAPPLLVVIAAVAFWRILRHRARLPMDDDA